MLINKEHLRKLSNELIAKNPNGGMYLSPQLVSELIKESDRLEWMYDNDGIICETMAGTKYV